MKLNNPVKGSVYTLAQVFDLNLLDSPSLGFSYSGRQCVIQDSHVTVEELLTVPDLALTEWRYVRTTNEWIPVFEAVKNDAVIACVDIEPEFDPHEETSERFWVTPKGFPRPQYYVPYSRDCIYPLYEILESAETLEVVKRDADGFKSLGDDLSEATFAKYQFVELVRDNGVVKAVFEVQQ